MSGFREIHAHFIYGIDDGAQTKSDMYAMIDYAHAEGITQMIATPHVTPGMERFNREAFLAHLDDARKYCERKGYAMQLIGGAEIMYTPAIERCAKDGLLETLGDSQYILMEFVPDIDFDEIEAAVSLMERAGYITVLAHIERYDCLYKRDRAYQLKKKHRVLYQVNGNTVIEGRGFMKNRVIKKWFKDQLIDLIASDAHDVRRRPFRMKDAYEKLCTLVSEEYAEALCMAE